MGEKTGILRGSELKPQWSLFISTADSAAFQKIYLHYYHYLTFIALKKGFSASKTKDFINELFMYVWENREKLSHIHNHHNYLLTAFLRKLYKKEISTEECLLNDQPELVFSPSVEDDYINKGSQQQVSDILIRLIGQLPEKQRSLIYQKFYLELSYDEIAKINHISINTVYNTIYKAVDKLKTTIGKDHLKSIYLTLMAISILFLIFFIKQ